MFTVGVRMYYSITDRPPEIDGKDLRSWRPRAKWREGCNRKQMFLAENQTEWKVLDHKVNQHAVCRKRKRYAT